MERESAVAKLLTIAGLGFIDAREGKLSRHPTFSHELVFDD